MVVIICLKSTVFYSPDMVHTSYITSIVGKFMNNLKVKSYNVTRKG